MEFIIAVIFIAATGIGAYLYFKSLKSASRDSQSFICPRCGDKDCHCEPQA